MQLTRVPLATTVEEWVAEVCCLTDILETLLPYLEGYDDGVGGEGGTLDVKDRDNEDSVKAQRITNAVIRITEHFYLNSNVDLW